MRMMLGKIFTLAALALIVAPAGTAQAAPVRASGSIANIADTTVHRCDATGGHCARLHIVVQTMDAQYIRTFASAACYSAAGDFPCAHIQGSAWLNCTALGGVDCGTNGPVVACGPCPSFNVVSPWYRLPLASQQYQGAAGIAFTTGASGGGSDWGLSGATAQFGF